MLFSFLENSTKNYPKRIAIESKDEEICYEDLYNISLSFGAHINSLVDNDCQVIGILMDKSIDFLISIYGILSVGKAYVPLDESLPPERLEYIVKDGSIDCIISDKKNYELSTKLCKKPVLFDRDNISTKEIPQRAKASPESMAYILYTSGSTGRPKGIMHTQSSAIAFILWAAQYFEVTESDVLSSHAPFHFDLSIFDIFVSAYAGARLSLLPKSISCFPSSLIKYIISKKITVWYSVPYIIVNMFSDENIAKCEFSNLRNIIYAGESLSIDNAKKIKERLPHVSLYNLYGPTETNVITYYEVDNHTWSRQDRQIPIGHCCPYANIKVINDDGKEANIGELGELCVKSDSLMLGYVGVEKTASMDQYYHTGDIVHIDDDGLIVFHGRKDYMTKVNGFRVELGDIENNIRGYPNITDCYAKVDRSNKRDKIIVTIEAASDLCVGNLADYLKKCLPGYMLPDEYILRDKLERNSRGKIVRK
ncbi:AMP-binding protein [Ruminiclostridium josui]|uniref:AMP-binding protein n=1 Tax=Ruminiclostridium josui TaxID=1499 RepID=UPI000463CB40|nr:AMP-binding protein [Ruminiclostridium josui]